jgi:hypothetical protein
MSKKSPTETNRWETDGLAEWSEEMLHQQAIDSFDCVSDAFYAVLDVQNVHNTSGLSLCGCNNHKGSAFPSQSSACAEERTDDIAVDMTEIRHIDD